MILSIQKKLCTFRKRDPIFGGCGRLLHALNPPRSAFLYLQFLERCHPYILFHFYTCHIYELHAHLCPHYNVLPANIYVYFTRTSMFTELFT